MLLERALTENCISLEFREALFGACFAKVIETTLAHISSYCIYGLVEQILLINQIFSFIYFISLNLLQSPFLKGVCGDPHKIH